MNEATAFNSLKAAHEELAGLADVQRTLSQRERAAEEAMSLAENELNAIRKIVGYVRISIETLRQRINELERAKETSAP